MIWTEAGTWVINKNKIKLYQVNEKLISTSGVQPVPTFTCLISFVYAFIFLNQILLDLGIMQNLKKEE